jgi:hypothetical protein
MNRLDRNKHGGGIITYCRSTLNPTSLTSFQDRAVKSKIEMTVTKLHISSKKLPILVLGIYRPPNAPSGWFASFDNIITDLIPLGSLIIMGDLNADLLCPNVNPTKALRNSLSLAGTKIGKKDPTRITPHSATCLDLIAIDKSIDCLQYKVGNELFSDHLPVIAKIKGSPSTKLQPVKKRSFRGVDFEEMRDRISSIQPPMHTDLDTAVGQWHDDIINILDDMAPIKNFPWRRERCPWITADIRSLFTNRELLVKQLKKREGNQEEVCFDLKKIKKQIKSRIKREVKEAGKTALALNDSKKAWHYIKSATFTHSKSSESIQDLESLNNFLQVQFTQSTLALFLLAAHQ